jgi:hypothetical protein
MPPENVIHIKLNSEEAIKAKTSILSSEVALLNVAKRLVRYHNLRMQELNSKSKLYTKMKETKANIKRLQTILPSGKRY